MNYKRMLVLCLLAMVIAIGSAPAQTAAPQLKGTVTDESGSAIPGAAVTITGPGGSRNFSTNELGVYTVTGLPAGKYTVNIVSTGFAPARKTGLDIQPGKALTLDAQLKIASGKQEITVLGEANTVSVEASANAGAIVLHEVDLAALSDDPDDLAADLQALAGPSAGPNGGQIFIDGFSNGKLPPKSSIREVRINQNPFSAEFDRLGYGRIEVFTKPGTDKFRGSAFFSDSNNVFNSRNPFSSNKADFSSRFFGGNISGPISKKSSFFVDFERRQVDDNALIRATTLDSSLNPVNISQSVVTPQTMTTLSPRVDYALTPKITLVGRYTYSKRANDNVGLGGFSLASQAYNSASDNHNVQITETAMISPRVVNETRIQFFRTRSDQFGTNNVPAINVLESFVGGGSQVGRSWNQNDLWEFQNYTSWTAGKHAFRAGARIRYTNQNDNSASNFGGTFTFGGSVGPLLDANFNPILGSDGKPLTGQITSLDRYRRTLYFQQQGMSPAAIRQLGGGATQFSIAGGNPLADVRQTDAGVFLQDDWRVAQNFTLSLGLRYEAQSNLSDWKNLAPRVGFAWAPGAKGGKTAKTVFRGGFGTFYTRFDDNYTLSTLRFNGINQAQYVVVNPDFYPNAPTIAQLNAIRQPQTIREKDNDLRAPYILQGAMGVERQLPWNSTLSVTYTVSRGDHVLRSVVLNPGQTPSAGVPSDRIYEYQSTGILRQNQLITSFRTNVKKVSLNAWYAFNHAKSDSDGAASFPSDPNNFQADYGRSSLDARHRFGMFGSYSTKYNIRFSPFIIASSGGPFNIISGRDLNGDSIINDRPAFATDLTKPGVVVTQFGAFDPNPGPGAVLIPRNYGQSPGSITINMRVSKTWGFGEKKSSAAMPGGDMGGMMMGGPRGGGDHGPRGGGSGGFRGGGGHGPGGGGMFGGDSTDKRFNLTLSVSARNLLNHVNPGAPVGNLTSPYFGQSLSTGGGFGPMGGSAANNRRLDFQLRLSF